MGYLLIGTIGHSDEPEGDTISFRPGPDQDRFFFAIDPGEHFPVQEIRRPGDNFQQPLRKPLYVGDIRDRPDVREPIPKGILEMVPQVAEMTIHRGIHPGPGQFFPLKGLSHYGYHRSIIVHFSADFSYRGFFTRFFWGSNLEP